MNEQVKKERKFNCEVCGKEKRIKRFDYARAYRFCSQKCAGLPQAKHIDERRFYCAHCGKEVVVRAGEKRRIYKFCSSSCSLLLNGQNKKDSKSTGQYLTTKVPEHPRANKDGFVFTHILVAERALGHYLPEGAIVHHANKNKEDNRPENLVICPDRNYHLLLHWRMSRKEEFGNPNLKRCKKCRDVLHLQEYPVNNDFPDGREDQCNNCFKGHTGKNGNKTHCMHGHPFDEENTAIMADGKRACKTCRRIRSKEAQSEKRWYAWQRKNYFDQIGLGV